MENKRSRFAAEREAVPGLLKQVSELRQKAASMSARFQARPRFELLSKADAIEREARIRTSRARELDFDRAVAAYSHCERSFRGSSSTAPVEEANNSKRIITAPGAPAQTMDSFVQKHMCKESLRSALVQEYINDLEHKAPKLNVRGRDDCPLCVQPMRLNHVKSVLVCESCGYAAACRRPLPACRALRRSVRLSSTGMATWTSSG